MENISSEGKLFVKLGPKFIIFVFKLIVGI